MAMAKRSDLVDALAAVAVSALSGPLGAIGVSAAGELVKLFQKVRGRTSEERELQKQIREAITAWAKGEHLGQDVVDRGLAWVDRRSGFRSHASSRGRTHAGQGEG